MSKYFFQRIVCILGALRCCEARNRPWAPKLLPRVSNDTSDVGNALIYEALNDYPNATGSFETIGFDLTKPYSTATSNQTGWTLDIRVATNVSHHVLIYDNLEDNKLVRVNPTQILLNSPDDAFSEDDEVDSGWTSCVYVWEADLKDSNSTSAEQTDEEGTCTNVLSEQCLSDLRANSVSRGKCMAAIGVSDSCKEFFGKGNGNFGKLTSLLIDSILKLIVLQKN